MLGVPVHKGSRWVAVGPRCPSSGLRRLLLSGLHCQAQKDPWRQQSYGFFLSCNDTGCLQTPGVFSVTICEVVGLLEANVEHRGSWGQSWGPVLPLPRPRWECPQVRLGDDPPSRAVPRATRGCVWRSWHRLGTGERLMCETPSLSYELRSQMSLKALTGEGACSEGDTVHLLDSSQILWRVTRPHISCPPWALVGDLQSFQHGSLWELHLCQGCLQASALRPGEGSPFSAVSWGAAGSGQVAGPQVRPCGSACRREANRAEAGASRAVSFGSESVAGQAAT